jgi:hypothetical protein
MDIDYPQLIAQTFTVCATDDTPGHTFRLRKMNALMQLTLPRQMTKAFIAANGHEPETDAEVQAWFNEWTDTYEGTAFCLDAAFEPVDGGPSLASLMRADAFGADDLAKVIVGMHSFFASAPVSSSKPRGTGKRSPKRAAIIPAGPSMAQRKSQASTSRRRRS